MKHGAQARRASAAGRPQRKAPPAPSWSLRRDPHEGWRSVVDCPDIRSKAAWPPQSPHSRLGQLPETRAPLIGPSLGRFFFLGGGIEAFAPVKMSA
eukprot:3891784-Pyramimonas_sp.AAC.1